MEFYNLRCADFTVTLFALERNIKPESVIRILCLLNLMVISASCHSHFLSESWPHRSLNVARYVGERRCNQSSRNKDGL